MKRLLLLFTIPTLSYSQITYKDIMNIHTENTYKKVVIENGYELMSKDDTIINYGLDVSNLFGNEMGNSFSSYNKISGGFYFGFSDNTKEEYDLIVDELKEKCKFFEIFETEETDFVLYSCSESKYSGKIGISVYDGMNIIIHYPE